MYSFKYIEHCELRVASSGAEYYAPCRLALKWIGMDLKSSGILTLSLKTNWDQFGVGFSENRFKELKKIIFSQSPVVSFYLAYLA